MEEKIVQQRILDFLKQNIVVIAILGVGLICLVVGLISMMGKEPSEIRFESDITDKTNTTDRTNNTKTIFVDVSGEVEKPGLYELPNSARIADAITKAGGMTEEANRKYVSQIINLAQKLEDGSKLYIPSKNKTIEHSETTGSGQSTYHSNSSTVNINSASAQELDKLPGIGTVRAQKIIDNRPYSEKKELLTKKVVTQKIFGEIEGMISVY